MHLADVFIKSNSHGIQATFFLNFMHFSGIQTLDLGIVFMAKV